MRLGFDTSPFLEVTSPRSGGFQTLVYEANSPRFDSWRGDHYAIAHIGLLTFVLADSRCELPKLVGRVRLPTEVPVEHPLRAYTQIDSPNGQGDSLNCCLFRVRIPGHNPRAWSTRSTSHLPPSAALIVFVV